MTSREDAEAALRAGRNAAVGAANPYTGVSLVLAKLWQRGYMAMLTRSASTSATQDLDLSDPTTTFRDEAVAAYRAGRGAAIGDVNPYRGQSIAFAQLWRRGYQAMLTERAEATSAMQEYRRARAEDAAIRRTAAPATP